MVVYKKMKNLQQEVDGDNILETYAEIHKSRPNSEYRGELIKKVLRLQHEYKVKYGQYYLVTSETRQRVNGF